MYSMRINASQIASISTINEKNVDRKKYIYKEKKKKKTN
jgi:hypothetical protein